MIFSISYQPVQEKFLAFILLYLLLNLLGLSLNKWKSSKIQSAAAGGRSHAGIRDKLVVFFSFQLLLFSLSYASRWGVTLFFTALILGVVWEAVRLVNQALSPVPKGLLLAFTGLMLGSLSTWIALHWMHPKSLLMPMLFLLIAVNDAYAQVIGEIFRGPKLAPALSPNKTWSGFLGGVTATVLTGVGFGLWVAPVLPLKTLLWICPVLSILCMVGDLAASWVKRNLAIKDFSRILGASGGVLDRIDSYLLAGYFSLLTFTPLTKEF